MINSSRLARIVTLFGVVSLLLIGSSGIFHSGMDMQSGKAMGNCPFMPGMTALCNMSPLEHVAAWQSMFTTTAAESALTLILLLIFAAIVFVYSLRRELYPEPRAPLLYRKLAVVLCRSPLQEAFSNGILNPKVF